MTRVFKFGGGSVKDADGIRHLIEIVKSESKEDRIINVVSALGKTTNALEEIVSIGFKAGDFGKKLEKILADHLEIAQELCGDSKEVQEDISEVDSKIKALMTDLMQQRLRKLDFIYDQIVSFGEILSTRIIYHAMQKEGIDVEFIDAREVVFTNARNRNGGVLWDRTQKAIQGRLEDSDAKIFITQGFIGTFEGDYTTTLGREGSDFSGAIFASSVNAPSLTIWKDVPGIMNSDPKISNPNYVFSNLSYFETSELTYYGATVIHPKTIKPLANKNIPIFVRSFFEKDSPGTEISTRSHHKEVPTLILKKNQALISFTTKNFEFIKSYHLELIFSEVQNLAVSVNLTQSSAISFSVVADFHEERIINLINSLDGDFHCKYNFGLSLLTIKNYTPEILMNVEKTYSVLLEQKTRNTSRILIENPEDRKITFEIPNGQ